MGINKLAGYRISAFLLPFFATFMLSSCMKHITVTYQAEKSNTGTLVLKPNKPTAGTYVTINDNLIVNNKGAKSIIINNLPSGEYSIHYTSENMWYKEKMDARIPLKMDAGREITKLVEVPPYSTGYWIYTIGLPLFLLSIPAITGVN
jgi:hypothetical protein